MSVLPCLVTALTIARKQSVRFAAGVMARQAIGFSLVLGWCRLWLAHWRPAHDLLIQENCRRSHRSGIYRSIPWMSKLPPLRNAA